MNKLFQTLFVLLVMSSPVDVAPEKQHQGINASKLLSFSQPNRKSTQPRNLAGLFGITEYQAINIKQPHNDFNQLYQKAISGQTELETVTQKIAQQSNTYIYSSGVKSKQRARDKVAAKYTGHSEKITDLARTSMVAQDIPGLINAFELLEKNTQILRIKNRFVTPNPSGYRDLSLLVRLPESGIVAEVQLHLEAFSVIKNGKEHDNYELIQKMQRLQLSENRGLNEIEQASIYKLRNESQQMYQQAWDQYLSA
ncbi:conserved hypothetical protein [Psychromonas ingrahamii 37]|uniref:RelA/SpoT domain-containing protein n=1 Tax=Psychromonas ingrahamii (strain DSM 17664 / CCUG 51855 / 37) TaxID=357804 RepID=A1SXY5_PSYIN|nr:hypothetical protein [Psychromonas ingrahamii]ABM04350.1 conserved hypothetical protein [Psychromonas ingrahamii 37]